MSKKSKRKRAIALFSTLVSLFVLVVLFGIICTVAFKSGKEFTKYKSDSEKVLDTDGGSAQILIETAENANQNDETDETADSKPLPGLNKDDPKRVICWGDSLTQGNGGGGMTYPLAIQNAATTDHNEIEVLNYGVSGELTSLIAARCGGCPLKLEGGITIPAECTPVSIKIKNSPDGLNYLLTWGGDREFSAQGQAFKADNSVNPCIFVGDDGTEVEGNIICSPDDGSKSFVRLTPGEAVHVSASNRIQTWPMRDHRTSDVLVIWTGNNDKLTPSSAQNTIKLIESMVKYTYDAEDKDITELDDKPYLVLNLSQIDQVNGIDEVNAQISEAFKGHVLDIRSYLLNEALADANLPAEEIKTEEDAANLEKGKMPQSLYGKDGIHFTYRCYEIVGERIYEELKNKGYL